MSRNDGLSNPDIFSTADFCGRTKMADLVVVTDIDGHRW